MGIAVHHVEKLWEGSSVQNAVDWNKWLGPEITTENTEGTPAMWDIPKLSQHERPKAMRTCESSSLESIQRKKMDVDKKAVPKDTSTAW